MDRPVDRRGRLDEGIFTYRITKDQKVFISWRGKQVTTLSGDRAADFIADISGAASEKASQLIMAKATGHFKHGNERANGPHY